MVGRRARPSSPPDSGPSSGGQITLPHLVLDPIWSLRQWPVVTVLAGQDYTIQALCAADWLSVLMEPELTTDDVFPGLLNSDDQRDIEDLLHQGKLDYLDIQNIALDVIGKVSGRHWWVTMRLAIVAFSSWDALGGEMTKKADATTLSLAGWLDVLFLTILRSMDDSKRTMFLMQLELPPKGWEQTIEPELMSADAFLAMAGE